MTAILEITDGTTTVSLLGLGNGFNLGRWRPAIAQYKGRGTWQSSPMADGRRLVARQWGNVIETFVLKVNDFDQDAVIRDTQDLRRLLEKAVNFWATDWQDTPVYIKAQATCETYPRYAIIKSWSTPDDENPFNQPFLQRLRAAVMDRWTLVIERGPFWTADVPQSSTAVAISAVEAYDGRNLGNVDDTGTREPVTTNDVFFANKHNIANLTDIYIDNGGAWSGNLMDAALPFDLLPAAPVVDDAVYFGIDTAVADSGPFASLVFDLSIAQNDLTILWEYYDGVTAGWEPGNSAQPFPVEDGTNAGGAMTGDAFDTTGVNSVHWVQPTNWATRDLTADGGPAVTGYWVRARVTAVGAAPTPPRQQNRDIYSINWGYIEIQSNQTGGDIASLMRSLVHNRSDGPTASDPELWSSRVICGLRSMSRGANFFPYLMFSDTQLPAGHLATPGANAAFADDVTSPSGRILVYTPVGAEALAFRANYIIAAPGADPDEWRGEYHVFMRGQQSGGNPGDITVRFEVAIESAIATVHISREKTFTTTNAWQLIDFDKLRLPLLDDVTSLDEIAQITFIVSASSTGAGPTLRMVDLVLMPVDEWAGDFLDIANTSTSMLGRYLAAISNYLDIDSVEQLKKQRAMSRRDSDGRVAQAFRVISNGKSILQANSRQRLWFLTSRYAVAFGAEMRSEPWVAHSAQVFKNQRYFSMRGSR